ncbi:MAG TPA: hypothetical protein VJY62_01975 [Bacteroidia bacterium]|nr:hypothetical protein [Bacteroidia bacterium]
MKKVILLSIVFLLTISKVYSQNSDLKKDEKPEEPKYELHQFYLKDPAIKILDIQYDNDCTPVKGKLSEDGKTVFIKDYTEHSRIYLKFLKADGKAEEITKSPCFIDPVVNAL